MSPTLTTTQQTEIKLSPLLRRKLLLKLKTFAQRKAEITALEIEQETLKTDIEVMFAQADEERALRAGVKMEGFSVKHHYGEKTNRLDKKTLMAIAGVTTAQLEEATKSSPKKAYTKIHCPGEKTEEAE